MPRVSASSHHGRGSLMTFVVDRAALIRRVALKPSMLGIARSLYKPRPGTAGTTVGGLQLTVVMIGSCGSGSGGGCDTPVLVKVQVTVSSAAKVMEAVAVPGPVTGGAAVGNELVAGPEQLRVAIQSIGTVSLTE